MSAPRIVVVGGGSIGSRHARNLVGLGAEVTVLDPDPARAGAVDGVQWLTADLDDGPGPPADGIVVASPTSMHARHLRTALARAPAVMVEKPLAVHPSEMAPDLDLDRVMVGYNLRLVPELGTVVSAVHGGQLGIPLAARCWFGSWLPGWRPTVDYRATYSARAALGGGVLLDAIHELDLLVWLAGDGDFSVVGAVVDRVGDLEIDCEDTVKALLRHRSGLLVELSLDYLASRYRRGIEVIGSEATMLLDWETGQLRVSDREGCTAADVALCLDEAYVEEARRFLGFVERHEAPPVGGREGLTSLELAQRIRAAAQ